VYANSVWNGFAYDDLWIIGSNERVHQLRDLSRIWLTPYWPSFGSQLGLYRPLAIFAFAVEWAISGGKPWFFHLTNVLLHTGVSVLVFLLIEKLFSSRAALAGALVFAIHPLHTEAVANVVGQNELWAALGLLAACLIYVRRPELGLSWKQRFAIIALSTLALLAKESAVVLPGLLVLLDFVQRRVPLDRAGLLRYVRAVMPLMLLFIAALSAYLVLRQAVLGNLSGTDAAPGLPYLKEQYRVLNALRAWPEFVRLLAFPFDLSVDYGPAVVMPAESFTPMVLLGLMLLLAIMLLMLATPWAPRAGLVAGWFLITILPVSNLFFPIGVLIAERTLYTPSLAVCFLAGYAWEAVAAQSRVQTRRLGYALAAIVVLGFGARTVIRNPDWKSLASVWKSLHRDHPESYRAQWLNAVAMWNAGRFDLAERYFELAYRIWPRDSQLLTEWANFYIGQKRWDKAIPLLERSRDMTPFVPRTQEYLAYSYLYAGRPRDALATAEHALKMDGAHHVLIYPVLASALHQLGRYREAAYAWHEAVQKEGGDLWLNWAMLARSEAAAGDTAAATRSTDVALSKINKDETSKRVVRGLKQAIASGCYEKAAEAGESLACDPLVTWQVVVGTPAAQTQ
jgi:tetratricopeptide (TPR) repeat protein